MHLSHDLKPLKSVDDFRWALVQARRDDIIGGKIYLVDQSSVLARDFEAVLGAATEHKYYPDAIDSSLQMTKLL